MRQDGNPVLLISGTVGSGKTSTGHEISELLEDQGIAHCFVDLDALTQTYPWPAGDAHGTRLALTNLRAVWQNSRAAGAQRLIVACVMENQAEVADLLQAVNEPQAFVCLLIASPETLLGRIATREIGSGYDAHAARALDLADQLNAAAPRDATVATDGRPLRSVAQEILTVADWLP